MNKNTMRIAITLAVSLLLCGMEAATQAASVDVRISAREAYVGMPVILQIAITNAEDYKEPTVPEIDGCDVRAAGAPSQSTQITIINGRRSESRSVTLQFLITPRRAGTFEIPSLTVNVDGRDRTTTPLRFVATKSEAGDLLMVEVEGGKKRVFVGQPLDLTLKIWIKPFRDREKDLTLSEANMWQMVSDQSSWGSFSQRMTELAENNQRPGGHEVLRDDRRGVERSYYLYEINATVYPKRPGKIDADDVQVVVNYPTALGTSRSPFDGFFSGSPFGTNSRLSKMMDDDFFASPFGNRLTVSAARPIVAEAQVDSTEVVPVPTDGRPADYRGAVGRYRIVTEANPTSVSAGDPITLNIGILGTGPMELVQAPPLSELPTLTADFKVADESLAGFVKDNTKVFTTTIRPRREGITEIPSIPFSFFDPDAERFETVESNPISITVDKSESLALDAIVANSRDRRNANQPGSAIAAQPLAANFTNDNSSSLLVSQSPALDSRWWWTFLVVPPLAWLVTLVFCHGSRVIGRLPSLRSARHIGLSAIDGAKDQSQVTNALVRYIARRSGRRVLNLDADSAVGVLRTSGLNPLANSVESFFHSYQHAQFRGMAQKSTLEIQQTARELLEQMESSFSAMNKSQVRRSSRRRPRGVTGHQTTPSAKSVITNTWFLLFAALLAITSGRAQADVDEAPTRKIENRLGDTTIQLTKSQQQIILAEAGDIYARATGLVDTDAAEADELFTTAAAKYQLLVNSGIRNSRLYRNLGNAYLRSHQLGRAIANYELARRLTPGDRQLLVNLELAQSLVAKPAADKPAGTDSTSLLSIRRRLAAANDILISLIGLRWMIGILIVASLSFWGILIVRTAGLRFAAIRYAAAPLLILLLSLVSVTVATSPGNQDAIGIIVSKNVALHTGDGEQFDEISSADVTEGHRVQILAQRGDWTRVRTTAGHEGWVRNDDVTTL